MTEPSPAQTSLIFTAFPQEGEPYDHAALSAALARGQSCTVVWSLQATLVAALEAGTPPSAAAESWSRMARDWLDLATRHPDALHLIEAAPPADLQTSLAQLLIPHLPGVQPLLAQLRAQSRTNPEAPLDIDRVALHLAASPLAQQQQEILLLREHVVALSSLLHDAGRPAMTHPQIEAAFSGLLSSLVAETDRRLDLEASTPSH